jgi:hypothetical protein
MADNTEEEHLDNPVNIQSENTSNEISPTTDTETITPNQEPKNMEVHKHPHHVTHKKKLGEYLLEFSMLFLAVFLGFLAEYELEHVIEKDREKEYMVTMLEDIKADMPLLDSTEKGWDESNNSADSVVDAITFPIAKADLTKVYRHINEALNSSGFKYNDRTIAQLKNAGGFRILRNKEVANKIIAYDQFNNNEMAGIAAKHTSFYETVTKLRNKVFAQEIISRIYSQYQFNPPPLTANYWIDSMISNNRIPVQTETQSALMFEFKNAMLAYKQDYNDMEWAYNDLLKKQQELITLICKEYHLK